ncbi:MAG: hypothetical protein ACLR5H_06910 [Oscillospiraceae bacterium]
MAGPADGVQWEVHHLRRHRQPLNDGTWTYTWQHSRQLASMSKSGSSIAYGYNAKI